MIVTKKAIRKKAASNLVPRPAAPSRRRSRLIERHLAQRDQIWPDAADRVWNWSDNKGYVHMPRLLPLVMQLIRHVNPKINPSLVYLELWSRCLDGGFLELDDEEAHAYASGYDGQRAVRTWRERMRELERLGFIESRRSGNREFGFVLIPDPLHICVELKKRGRPRVPDAWWTAFLSRAKKIGADLRF
jgi:hypothetical protein